MPGVKMPVTLQEQSLCRSTNGCYRLHPVEWNIGEAAGLLAVHALEAKTSPRGVRADAKHLAAFQQRLTRHGVELQWPKVRPL